MTNEKGLNTHGSSFWIADFQIRTLSVHVFGPVLCVKQSIFRYSTFFGRYVSTFNSYGCETEWFQTSLESARCFSGIVFYPIAVISHQQTASLAECGEWYSTGTQFERKSLLWLSFFFQFSSEYQVTYCCFFWCTSQVLSQLPGRHLPDPNKPRDHRYNWEQILLQNTFWCNVELPETELLEQVIRPAMLQTTS